MMSLKIKAIDEKNAVSLIKVLQKIMDNNAQLKLKEYHKTHTNAR